MKALLCIVGATASGKTALAVEAALRYGGEIVSCDSMQVYRGMDIGTAKPCMEERRGIPHHMLDVAEPNEHYDAGRYALEAEICVEDVFARGKMPIVCGGTGLYLKALTRGLADIPDCPPQEHGPDAYSLLLETDPKTAERISPQDTQRIFRALDVWKATGKPLSWYHEQNPEPKYRTVCVGIGMERDELYRRIEKRVDEMMVAGWQEETERLLKNGADSQSTAMQAIGYRELAGFLSGMITLEEATDKIKTATRHYAKRQITWFGRQEEVFWLSKENIFSEFTNIMEIYRSL